MKDVIEIEGDFVICKSGDMYIGERRLIDTDKVNLPVSKIREIIVDSKAGVI